jgi:hypothetical protein
MALLYIDGFDAGDFFAKGWTGTAASATVTRFNAGRSLLVDNAVAAVRSIPATTSLVIGYAIRHATQDYNSRVINLMSDSGTISQLNFKWTNSTTFALQRNSTTIASATVPFLTTNWYYIEVALTVADSGGTCVIKINGATIINFTGDTRNGGATGAIDTIQINNGSSNTSAYVDDLYICDMTGPAPYNTFLGEVRVYSLSPSAAGYSTQFTPLAGANYTNVDELPYSAADYVTSGTVGHLDMYTMSDLPISAGTVLAIQNNTIAKKTDSAVIALKTALKSGASTYYGVSSNLGTFDSTLSDLRTTDPATGVAWTQSGINSLEAGFEVA